MIYTLPSQEQIRDFLHQLSQGLGSFFKAKTRKYQLATVIDLILIALILFYGRQPAQRLITPVVTSINSFYTVSSAHLPSESFAFVPDLARNKFSSIDLEGLTVLSFFDVPVTEEGINYNSRGYASFTSPEAAELFDRARFNQTKIFLTLSALSHETIENLLNSDWAKRQLADQVIEEIKLTNIDGITIDFECSDGIPHRKKFTQFISYLSFRLHADLPEAKLAIAVPSSKTDNSLYDIRELAKTSDKIFLIASDFIVPEVQGSTRRNPVYGFSGNEYFASIAGLISNLTKKLPAEKLALERAWYGNGNNYPLYKPSSKPVEELASEPAPIELDQDTIDRLAVGVPYKGKEAARKNIPLIAKALNEEGILDTNVLAYALATIEHETDETFEPIEEIQGRINARRLGYEGGSNYFGRGFIQITHLRNYRQIGERIGMGDKLAKDPQLATDPEVAAKILAAFFKDNNVANLASQGYFVAARNPVNPDRNGYLIADLANKYWLY
ncbi:hypothetical protein HYU93_04940 [Candidatus Daviesbacteria bacterium]|nr:hypothetical protein [Candidatus Daviesbacteria bacterium]